MDIKKCAVLVCCFLLMLSSVSFGAGIPFLSSNSDSDDLDKFDGGVLIKKVNDSQSIIIDEWRIIGTIEKTDKKISIFLFLPYFDKDKDKENSYLLSYSLNPETIDDFLDSLFPNRQCLTDTGIKDCK